MKKNPTVKTFAFATLTAGVMLLSACSSGTQSANNSNSTPQNNTSPTTNQGAGSGSGNVANNDNGSNSNNGSANGGNTASGQTGNGSLVNAPAPVSSADLSVKEIKAILTLAKDGKVKGIPFAAHTDLIDDVQKQWGKADNTVSAGKGLYATYAKKHAVIGFNKGSQIFDVRSSASELQKLTLKQIEAALGKAAKVTKNGNDSIYTYKANKTYELRFVIPSGTGKVHHISVYAPGDAVNNMVG